MITSPLVGIILFMAGAMSLLWTLLVVDIDFDLNPNIRITSLPSQVAARFALRLIFALTTFLRGFVPFFLRFIQSAYVRAVLQGWAVIWTFAFVLLLLTSVRMIEALSFILN
jgi:hypothetical protein